MVDIVYDLIAGLSILSAFLCLILTGHISFPNKKNFSFRDARKNHPIRLGLFGISILMFLSICGILIAPITMSWYYVFRALLIIVPHLAASVLILWTVYEIEIGKWYSKRVDVTTQEKEE